MATLLMSEFVETSKRDIVLFEFHSYLPCSRSGFVSQLLFQFMTNGSLRAI